MNGTPMQLVFSPQNCTIEVLDKTLTPGRRNVADHIIGRMRQALDSGGSHHTLIVGPRGSGKTHLLAFISKTLSHSVGIPFNLVVLSEEERGVSTLLDILLAIFRHLDAVPSDYIQRIRSSGKDAPRDDAIRLFDEVIEGRPTIIMIEYLSDVLASMDEEELHKLRALLEERPHISLLASSVRLFENSASRHQPFHGFFTIQAIAALSPGEARTFLSQVAEVSGREDLAQALAKENAQARVNAMYRLTGGNHRLLAMLCAFLTEDRLSDLVRPFVQLIDRELIPYYQQRLDRLSPQQNKIIRAIADHHGRAMNVKDLAAYTFLSSQSVSRQLHELQHGALVERTPIGRESFYELSEPLLRHTLDLKEGRDRFLPFVVRFLRDWYDAERLQHSYPNIEKWLDRPRDLPKLLDFLKRAVSKNPETLAGALTIWLRNNLPVRKESAGQLQEANKALRLAFGDIADVAPILEVLAAVLAHVQGDGKAMLTLPMEIRTLVQEAQNESSLVSP